MAQNVRPLHFDQSYRLCSPGSRTRPQRKPGLRTCGRITRSCKRSEHRANIGIDSIIPFSVKGKGLATLQTAEFRRFPLAAADRVLHLSTVKPRLVM